MDRSLNPVSEKKAGLCAYSGTMMKRYILILIMLIISFSSQEAYSDIKTFVKDYSYRATEIDSKISCRTIALTQVKQLLLEELGVYLESYTEVKNYQLSRDSTITLSAGIVHTEIVEERFDGETYWAKFQLKADPDSVAKSLRNYKNDWQKTRELEELKKNNAQYQMEIESLKQQLKIATSPNEKENLTKAYNCSRS